MTHPVKGRGDARIRLSDDPPSQGEGAAGEIRLSDDPPSQGEGGRQDSPF